MTRQTMALSLSRWTEQAYCNVSGLRQHLWDLVLESSNGTHLQSVSTLPISGTESAFRCHAPRNDAVRRLDVSKGIDTGRLEALDEWKGRRSICFRTHIWVSAHPQHAETTSREPFIQRLLFTEGRPMARAKIAPWKGPPYCKPAVARHHVESS